MTWVTRVLVAVFAGVACLDRASRHSECGKTAKEVAAICRNSVNNNVTAGHIPAGIMDTDGGKVVVGVETVISAGPVTFT